MNYIQRKGDGYLETVDEFNSLKESKKMIVEYCISDPTAEYYISTRACYGWEERE